MENDNNHLVLKRKLVRNEYNKYLFNTNTYYYYSNLLISSIEYNISNYTCNYLLISNMI